MTYTDGMDPIFYVAICLWAAYMFSCMLRVFHYEDLREEARREALRVEWTATLRDHVQRMRELESIHDLPTLEAFRIKEGLPPWP